MGFQPQADEQDKNISYSLPEMEQQEWYKGIYDLAPTLCVVLNSEGIVIDCNLAYAKALGFNVKAHVIGNSIFKCADDGSKDSLRKSFEVWRKTGKLHNHEFKMKRADGSTFPALINATSLYDELGRTIACNAVILNVTELANARKKLEVTMNDLTQKERELQETNAELRRVERAKEEFVSMVSHELKNPLTPIIGFSDILKNHVASGQQLTDKEVATIRIINQSAKDMKRLIDDVLSVYKLDMRLDFSFSDTKIVELVEQVLVELASIIDEKGITAEKNFSLRDGLETIISCDPLRLRQVFVNLVRNSVDFLPYSGGRIDIGLEEVAQQQDQRLNTKYSSLLISVSDNGPGIPADKVSGLFRKFYQASPSQNRKYGGTGLGLTICKEIVEMHGGKIWYDSTNTKGACFRFTLPRSRAAHPNDATIA